MWGFCAALESRLGHEAFRGALVDYESRRKLPALTRDLLALGASHASVSMLPRCSLVPECRDPAAAFGCVYVLEGATLGGRVLLPLVRSRLGLTEQSGASFLASYGEDIGPKWRTFGAALDAWCSGPRRRACAEQSAVATFQALEAWLCETQP
jgi:heme oxygenase